jgi:hypothetical protein
MSHHRLAWLVVLAWGLLIAALGMHAIDPAPLSPAELDIDSPARPAIYLLAAGIVTCMVGLIGLIGRSRPQGGDADSATPLGRLNR